ncbi:YfhO family protein [Ochrovirga pacifica]|uniref:YfhO family protein n=1 Tax=Ochrovirga pacifica TaxID=1042376 RepID=UPI000255A4D5|nr:YfhO family protein [Ochrovirga pacifica]
MKQLFSTKQLWVSIGVAIAFCVVALFYFKPVLKGYKIYQSDIAQFRGMSKELKDYREEHNKEAYWTDAAFGGMPSYQLSTYYPNDYIKKLDRLIRFLPRPADYLFLYFLGFFVLLTVLKFDWKLALIGSLAFGFSTYFIIILGVGHNAKAHAIGYIPLVMSGVLLIFQQRCTIGFILTAIATALEIHTSHPQMTYYMLFLLLIIGAFYVATQVQNGMFRKAIRPVLYVVVAMVIGVLMNAQSLLATKEYAAHSTRSKSELTINPDGSAKQATSGLSKDYITEYSYGGLELMNLMVPGFMGGANNENVGKDSHTYQFLASKIGARQAQQFAKNAPTYWGNQPIVAAPAYIGAVFIFLFFVGLFLVKGWLKKGILAAVIFSLLMSLGKNLNFLTNFFIDYVPLYNKFRAVTSIQIIAEICIPLLAMLAVKDLLASDVEVPKEQKVKSLKLGALISGCVLIGFVFVGGVGYSFSGINDTYWNSQLQGFSGALQADRKSMLYNDGFRSLILIAISVAVLWFAIQKKMKKDYAIALLGAVLLFDTFGVAKRYVNDQDFMPARQVEKPFQKSKIDQQILQDKGHYRVANFAGNFMNDGATSYYHKSIGGYHAAKLRRYQELVDFQINNNNIQVLNMLNIKYFIVSNKDGKQAQRNPDANGPVWLVDSIIPVSTADEEIQALTQFNSKKQVVVNTTEFKVKTVEKDSLASIELISYQPNELHYRYQANKPQLAVFSEIYYQPGWNAYVDGELTSHFRANYVLRAMNLPKGKHKVVFKFEPKVIAYGAKVSLVGYGLLILLSAGLIFVSKKQKGKE